MCFSFEKNCKSCHYELSRKYGCCMNFSGLFGIFVIAGNCFWLIINCFELLKIIRRVEKFRNQGLISNIVICEFLGIGQNIFGIFMVESQLILIIRMVQKFSKCGIISSLLICKFFNIYLGYYQKFQCVKLFYWNYWRMLEFVAFICIMVM